MGGLEVNSIHQDIYTDPAIFKTTASIYTLPRVLIFCFNRVHYLAKELNLSMLLAPLFIATPAGYYGKLAHLVWPPWDPAAAVNGHLKAVRAAHQLEPHKMVERAREVGPLQRERSCSRHLIKFYRVPSAKRKDKRKRALLRNPTISCRKLFCRGVDQLLRTSRNLQWLRVYLVCNSFPTAIVPNTISK